MTSEMAPASATASVTQSVRDSSLSPEAVAALQRGVPASTAIAYKRDWEEFGIWCGEVSRTALPASAETLTEYATHLAYREVNPRSPSSIERARSAIRSAHRAAAVDPPDSLGLAKVVKGYRAVLAEAKDPRAKPRQASAATKKILTAMIGGMDRGTKIGRRNAAIVLTGFCTAGRRSEVAALNITDFTETDEGLSIAIYRRKTLQHQDLAIPYASDTSLCPVLAVKEWIEYLAAEGRDTGPIFVRMNRHGHLGQRVTREGEAIGDPSGRMTGEAISDVIDLSARRAGLAGRWSGHSVRRGFATESRKAGHDRTRIARGGGWADDSPVLARYIEDADQWADNALIGVL